MAFDYSTSGKLGMVIVMIVLSVMSTMLRFWSRAVVLSGDYRWDDWFALLAMIVFLGQLGLEPVFLANGIGKNVTEVTMAQLAVSLKSWFAACILNSFGLTFSKLSVLVFYVRIFGLRTNINISWRVSVWVCVFLTLAYFFWSIPMYVTACRPVEKFWHPLIPGHCLSDSILFVSSAIFSVVVDILILLLPLPELLRLKMKKSRKFVLTVAFLIGYTVPAITIGRLVTVVVLKDELNSNFTRALFPAGYWLQAEPGITLFAISTPPMLQLCKRCFRWGPRSLFTSRQYSHTDERRDSESSTGAFSLRKGLKARFGTVNFGSADSGLFLATRSELNGGALSEVNVDVERKSTGTDGAVAARSSDHIRMERQYQVTYDV